MNKIYTLLIISALTYNANAQYYKTAVGLKIGWGIGLNAKHFLGENSDHAVETSLDFQKDGFILNGYYEYHLEAFKADGLRWYFGAGAYLGSWGDVQWRNADENLGKNIFVFGAVGIMGIEYTLENYPINFSIDLQPRYNLIGGSIPWATGGITVRYTFKEEEEEESTN